MSKTNGFTLLELSIVLVVIGFITGVVLFGQDMIQAARLRNLITQIERYNAATNVFLNKYSQLPGDIKNAGPTTNFFATSGVTTTCNGGNGNNFILTGLSSSTSIIAPTSAVTTIQWSVAPKENICYFNHLGAVGLIDFVGDGGSNQLLGKTLPYSSHGAGGFYVYAGFRTNPTIAVTADGGFNAHYFHIGIQNSSSATTATHSNTFSPRDAFSIDAKMDDGLPFSGAVMAFGDEASSDPELNPSRSTTTSDAACVKGVTPALSTSDTYNIAQGSKLCQLRVRSSF